MKNALFTLQAVSGIVLILSVLVQSKGTGFGRGVGPSSYHSRRGLEKVVFKLTIGTAIVFVITSFLNLLVV
jgi:protein translocase SecG subunit